MLVQLARASGARVLAVARDEAKLERIRAMAPVCKRHRLRATPTGSSRVARRSGTPARTSCLTMSAGPSASLRSSWSQTAGTTRPTARRAGSSQRSTPSKPRVAASRSPASRAYSSTSKRSSSQPSERSWPPQRGELTPVIGQTYPLERAAQAHAAIEARTVFAKTLLTMCKRRAHPARHADAKRTKPTATQQPIT